MTFRENVAMWLAGYGMALADMGCYNKPDRIELGIKARDPLTVFEGIRCSEGYERLRKEFAVSPEGESTGDGVMNTKMQLDFMLMVNPAHCRG